MRPRGRQPTLSFVSSYVLANILNECTIAKSLIAEKKFFIEPRTQGADGSESGDMEHTLHMRTGYPMSVQARNSNDAN